MSAVEHLAARAAAADWPRAHGAPPVRAVLRASPEDFEVEEIGRIEPEGEGTHLWCWTEKRGANTNWVAERLARAAGCAVRDVGFAGMKDRHAVTRQWFSVPVGSGSDPDWPDWDIEGVRLLSAQRHGRKLQRGALDGNRFRLVLRDLVGDEDAFDRRVSRIRSEGLPNYFGEQRFGHHGSNVGNGAAVLAGERRGDRRRRSIWYSAVRSALFNEVLGARVEAGTWNRLLPGEIAMLDGSRSVFPCEDIDRELEARCAAFDVHPTGPLPGRAGMTPAGEAGRCESAVLEPFQSLVDGLRAAGVDAARRASRLRPTSLECAREGATAVLAFELPAGAYATAVLRELVTVAE